MPDGKDLAVFHHNVYILVFLEFHAIVFWQHLLQCLEIFSGHESRYCISGNPACSSVVDDAFDNLWWNPALLNSCCSMFGDSHFS